VHTPRDEPATLARVSLDNAGRFMAAAVAAAANAPTSFVDGRRLDRYLARHGFIAGYTRASRPDWPALRRRGFDLVLWERPSGEAGASTSTSPDVVMVRGRDDLSDTEEGQPLRVLVARLDGTTLTFGAGAAPWRRIEGGWDAGSLTVRLIGAPSQVAATSSPDVGFVLDADSDVQVDEVTGALVGAGRTAEDAEALLSGRVRDALLRAIPPRRADHAQSGADQEGISALLISRRFSASITSPGTPR
jgi:hypothetical protein